MFQKINFLSNVAAGSVAGALFAAGVFFYIREGTYAASWMLYAGSFLFVIVVIADLFRFNSRRGKNANTVTMVFSSHVTTIIGVVVSCLLSFVLLSLMIPGYLGNGPAGKASPDSPVNTITDKTSGLSFRVFIAAIVVNFSFGSSASIIYPFTIRRNQKTDSGEPYPLEHREAAKEV